MPVTRAAEAPTYDLHGFTFRSLAATALGSPDLAVWVVEAPAGATSPRHTMSRDEVLLVRTGHVTAVVADETFDLAPGDTLTVPAGTPFQLANPHDEPASAVAVTTTGMHATVGDSTIRPPWAV